MSGATDGTRRVIYSMTVSLDGFIAGPGADMSWLTEHRGVELVAPGAFGSK